ncbi:MAG: aspartate aminotransferase family protein [Woeseiaceae bacterium]
MSGFSVYDDTELSMLAETVATLAAGYSDLPSTENSRLDNQTAMQTVLNEVATRMHDNYPYAHPLYAGQMLKPPHPIARIAYQMAMWVNPNNHALDGGRASSAMEKETVSEIAAMFGMTPFLGHLTSSGTLANFEALWIAGMEKPGKIVASSSDAHYTHARLTKVLHLPYQPVGIDSQGCMDMGALEALAKQGNLGTVVVTAGTTSFGAVDPVDQVIALSAQYDFRVHVDAAYGGYFMIADLPDALRVRYDAIQQADSLAIDPHKHGLQPYGCGCVLFKDPAVGRHYKHDSPYTYFSSDELHLGEISIECSRAGAAAVALRATQSLLPLLPRSEFSSMLDRCRAAADQLTALLSADQRFIVIQPPQLDIIIWAVRSESIAKSSDLAQQIFDQCAEDDLHLALIEVDAERLHDGFAAITRDRPTLTCLRSCLMKPEHVDWCDEIAKRLSHATSTVMDSAS